MIFQFAFELYLISTQEVHDADFNRTPSILLSDFFIVKLIYVFKNTAHDVNHFFFQWSVRSGDSLDACIYAEIRTRIPDTISWDYNFEPAGSTPLTFTVKVF